MSNNFENSVTLIIEILKKAKVNESGAFRLPSERSLAEEMGVQRSVIRNALSALEFFGFIDRAQGSGTYIKIPKLSFANVYFEIAMQLGYLSHDTIEYAREAFELLIVEEAAMHASDEEIEKLGMLCQVMMETSSFHEKVEADYNFHLELASMTHNPVLVLFYQSIASFIRDILIKRRSIVSAVDPAKTQINSNHTAIVEAIARRDAAAAKKAMKDHFEHWEKERLLINAMTSRS
ncbi:FadR/GntR family transcriptional regulator [Pectobacterium cacticida]|uniref:FadR/GntR family transcriptional regulator n=1 Tax=Pectobacterium cacticida TaxID=69221 RepID=UPI0039867932